MSITITPSSSLLAVRQLERSSRLYVDASERLSSGKRINRAADDAAGLAVSMSLSVRQRILGRGSLNLSDATSLLSITDGALQEASQVLVRMMELAEQASNGTISNKQRSSLSIEYEQLDKELRRIRDTTSFNGLNLLKGNRSARAGQAVYTDTGTVGSVQSVSPDGRYALFFDSSNRLKLADRSDGSVRTIDLPTGETNMLTSKARVLSNGDVAFAAFNGSNYNLYYYDKNTAQSRKLTNSISTVYDVLAGWDISNDGNTLTFFSHTRYADGGTVSGATQNNVIGSSLGLYSLDISSGTIRQISVSSAPSFYTMWTSPNGEYVAFKGPVQSGFSSARTASNSTINTTAWFGGTFFGIDNDGNAKFAAESNYTGQNPGAYWNMFSYNIASQSYVQHTNFSGITAPLIYTASPTLSTDGSMAYFVSSTNLTGENSIGANEVFSFDYATKTFKAMTAFMGAVSAINSAKISEDGGLIYTSQGSDILSYDITPDDIAYSFQAGGNSLESKIQSFSRAIRGLGGFQLTTATFARGALDSIQSSINSLSQARGVLGASLSRIEVDARVVSAQYLETVQANSRIVDADIASEAAQMLRATIKQQVSIAVLGQANLQPQLALRLLN